MMRYVLSILFIGLFLFLAVPVHAAKMYAVCRMVDGAPDFGALPFRGYVHIGAVGGWGAYLISGKQDELDAIAALPSVVKVSDRTDDKDRVWAEADEKIDSVCIEKVNEKVLALTSKSAVLKTDDTKRDAVIATFKEFFPDFDWQANWVRGPEDD